jgi:hypothetical protein
MLPRLVRIGPGERKSFTTTARIARVMPAVSADPRVVPRTFLRLKVNFLGDTAPFAELIDIPERAIADKERADALFTPWLERNEVIYTNTVPVQVTVARAMMPVDAGADTGARTPTPVRRGRRGGG